jgi:hypothetical protein
MVGITLSQAQAQLAAYLAAETAVLTGQSYTISSNGSSRELTRADLKFIQTGIEIWNKRVQSLDRGGIRVRTVEVDE